MNISVEIARTPEQVDHVRGLMRSFIGWHYQRHVEDRHLIDQYFDSAAFEEELMSLPGKYTPPKGQLLLATFDGAAAGCVALHRIDNGVCEMKRMFVKPHFQGKGIGRALARSVIAEARELGYTTMRLDTSIRQHEAKSLYQCLGFQMIEPYYLLPDNLRNWLLFMELTL